VRARTERRTTQTAEVHILGLLGHKVAGSKMRRSMSASRVSKTRKTTVGRSALTKPWRKATSNAATLDRRWNKRSGITGYCASFASLRRKQTPITKPNRIRQMTFAELHAKITPPNSRPRRSVNVAPTIAMLPNQSTAFSPATREVDGVSSLRKRDMTMMARPEHGTWTSQHERVSC
jgi:hypothetical protein